MRLSLNSIVIALTSTSFAVQYACAVPVADKLTSLTAFVSPALHRRDDSNSAQLNTDLLAVFNDLVDLIDLGNSAEIFGGEIFAAVEFLSAGQDVNQSLTISDAQNQVVSSMFGELMDVVNLLGQQTVQLNSDMGFLTVALAQAGATLPGVTPPGADDGDN